VQPYIDFYQIGKDGLLVHSHFQSSPDIDHVVASTSGEGVARTEQIVIEVDFLPLYPGWDVLMVESELIDEIGNGFRSHAPLITEFVPIRNCRWFNVTILQLALLSMGTTSRRGDPFNSNEPSLIF
jgi:hypothetical protein